MGRPDTVAAATVSRDADALVFRGALARDAVAGLWRQAQPLRAGIARLDLTAVTLVDSAGVALLAELANGSRGDVGRANGSAAQVPVTPITVVGTPPGLAELRAAYRLDDGLAFAS
jgi:phospholipid transport system transporter-binding protein